eukprot:COSAG02_NODE_67108_length_253_cov_3.006494_1_plen_26_part_01
MVVALATVVAAAALVRPTLLSLRIDP